MSNENAASYPENLKYTKDHEWILVEDAMGTVGVTHFAQAELGDIVYLELPDLGSTIEQGKTFGTIESVKAVSDLYAPVSGEIVERNEDLMDHPEGVNEDPHGKAWMVKVRLSDPSQLDGLLSAEAYQQLIQGAGH